MGEVNKINLDYLNEKEIIELYELFFGSILIKKTDFSYYINLLKSINKEETITNAIVKLSDIEKTILKILSFTKFIPYNFVGEKLSLILDISAVTTNRAIMNLIEKKYIFLRNNNTLVIPNIFYNNECPDILIQKINKVSNEQYNKILYDINNLIICFISKDIKFSNNFNLYKKDLDVVKDHFYNYSNFNELELNFVSYFYCYCFFDENNNLLINKLKNYYSLPKDKKLLYLINNTFPWFYNLLLCFKENTSVKIDFDNFKKLYTYTFLLTNYKKEPVKIDFDNILLLLKQFEIINLNKKENEIIFPILANENLNITNQVKLTTSFNIYINSDTDNIDYYLIAFFADLIKYNKVTEYEITENSIKRCTKYGITFNDIADFFKSFNIEIPKNVETTIKQWFDKFGSYYYTTGTIFFCQSPDKGKMINTLIDKGLINAYQIKKDEIYLIPEDDKNTFFEFLEKSGINYNYKKPQFLFKNEKNEIVDFKDVINFIELPQESFI